ncbi:MAG TPA: hypothetical protein VGM10_11320 [Actinocrinis sp.]|jgi:hypothetical protein
MGAQFMDEGAQLGQAASGFGGGAFQVADAFGLLGACDGAMEKYISMAQSTVQGLEQLASLWEQSGQQLVAQAEVYQACEEQQRQRIVAVQQQLAPAAGSGR